MNGEATVVFRKANGEIRNLRGTLNKDMMPADVVAKWAESETSEKKKRVNAEIQLVFDLDKQAWRTFRWDSFQLYIAQYADHTGTLV